jgi:predicted enzyme related to lactoylglutathione lyase
MAAVFVDWTTLPLMRTLSSQQRESRASAKEQQMTTKLECINPILPVRDIEASMTYYTKVLGFEKADWVTEGAKFAMVLRDGLGIYLSENSGEPRKAWVWIGAEDIQPIYEEFKAKGAHIRKPPTNQPWAYEMEIEDPDGHVLRFGSDALEDASSAG